MSSPDATCPSGVLTTAPTLTVTASGASHPGASNGVVLMALHSRVAVVAASGVFLVWDQAHTPPIKAARAVALGGEGA